MTDVQQVLYGMLQEIDAICQKHDITYYLGGGTALGAIRNGGLLPWDNDMDLYITRKEYDKFCAIIDQELKPDRHFVSHERNPYYLNPLPRYVNANTTKLYFSLMTDGEACGQHIEFLIFDPLPAEPEAQIIYKKKLQIYCELLQPYFLVVRDSYKQANFFDYELYLSYEQRVKSQGRDVILKELSDDLFSLDDSEAIDMYIMRWGLQLLCYNKAYFGKPRRVPFETGLFPVAQSAERIFRLAYGDHWMLIPPSAGREVKDAIDNVHVPAKKLVKLYHKGYDKNKAVQQFYDHKQAALFVRVTQEAYGKIDALKQLQKQQHATQMDVATFLSLQLDEQAMKYELAINAPTDIIEAAFSSLLKQGKFNVILKIANFRKQAQLANTNRIVSAIQTAEQMRELSIAYYDLNDLALIQTYFDTRSVTEDYPFFQALEYILIHTRIHEWHAQQKKDLLMTIGSQLNDAHYFNDDLFLKAVADIYLTLHQTADACNLYAQVASRTSNAFLINEINALAQLHDINFQAGYTSQLLKQRYEQALKKAAHHSKKSLPRRAYEQKKRQITYKIGYTTWLRKQPKKSAFSRANYKIARKSLKITEPIINKYRRKFKLVAEVAKSLNK